MGYDLSPFADTGLDEALLNWLIDEHESAAVPEFERFWSYYRNPCEPVEVRDAYGRRTVWRPAQSEGLPPRLIRSDAGLGPREIVIENDIAWRVQTLVDYMAGREVSLVSRASDPALREAINLVVREVFEASGGLEFVQRAALLACVYGHVDFVLRAEGVLGGEGGAGDRSAPRGSGGSVVSVPSEPIDAGAAVQAASRMPIETVEAPRSIPLLNPHDYRKLDAYILHYRRWDRRVEETGFLSRLGRWSGLTGAGDGRVRGTVEVTEILSASHRQVYEDGELIVDEPNRLGVLPVVHVQNGPQPYFYEGLSEVEPLIGLQDELNTRLSDRANRVTLQCFKMYLGKGIDGFGERPVGPGQMWSTDNPEASIEAFGGDAASPSEVEHVREIREALDKVSGVTPLAAGLLRAKVGTLSSENALRISMMGLLSKTERKRKAFGRGLSELFAMALAALDRAGVLKTRPEDRRVEVVWASPLPEDETKRLEQALMKRDLGVPVETILAELGYGPEDRSNR